MSRVRCQVLGVRWPMSLFTCHVSCVACHLSPVSNTNSQSHRPSTIMHSRMVYKDTLIRKMSKRKKNLWNNKNPTTSRGLPIIAIRSLTRSFQFTRKRVFCNDTKTHTDNSWTAHLREKYWNHLIVSRFMFKYSGYWKVVYFSNGWNTHWELMLQAGLF